MVLSINQPGSFLSAKKRQQKYCLWDCNKYLSLYFWLRHSKQYCFSKSLDLSDDDDGLQWSLVYNKRFNISCWHEKSGFKLQYSNLFENVPCWLVTFCFSLDFNPQNIYFSLPSLATHVFSETKLWKTNPLHADNLSCIRRRLKKIVMH